MLRSEISEGITLAECRYVVLYAVSLFGRNILTPEILKAALLEIGFSANPPVILFKKQENVKLARRITEDVRIRVIFQVHSEKWGSEAAFP
jgi:hypothetical protein